jgi:N-acetylneuraminate lyase
MTFQLRGLVAATHTPFHADGQLNLSAVKKQAEHLQRNGITTVFIGGTTGESHSLSVDERLALAQQWSEIVRGAELQLVIHVGSNCLADSRALAAQAQALNASAIAAFAPSYFKPRSIDTLIACCREIASAAPALPFYFYDIPGFTGVHLSMPEFLKTAPDRVPTLAGLKFTNPDLVAYQSCLSVQPGKFDIAWGLDECLLAALAVGAVGAVGSSYNFAAPIYHRLMKAFSRGDLEAARAEQQRSLQLIDLLASFSFMGAAKAVMGMLGVDVGPARLPNTNLTAEEHKLLEERLGELGFFDWLRR